ncbi:MAG: InlB B-repeat-containing protein [Desulfobacterales bacterium]|nr:InlB B-repeat-containing protein [Desulfobacterales bacterium]
MREFTGSSLTQIALGSTGDKTLYAKWTINQYTITFGANGGSAVAAITQDYNTAVTAPSNPTRTGYTFNGWSQAVPATMPAGNVTITAQWTINQYTITFEANGGSAVAAITQDYNTAIIAPANPTKTGYTFNGWSQAVPATMPAGNVTITAQWTSISIRSL